MADLANHVWSNFDLIWPNEMAIMYIQQIKTPTTQTLGAWPQVTLLPWVFFVCKWAVFHALHFPALQIYIYICIYLYCVIQFTAYIRELIECHRFTLKSMQNQGNFAVIKLNYRRADRLSSTLFLRIYTVNGVQTHSHSSFS